MRDTVDEGHRAEALDYMRGMLGQLQEMAERDGHDMLAYLIGMAHHEAADRVRSVRSSGVSRQQRD